MTNSTNPLLRANEAAKVLAISPRTLWSMTHRGEIPHVRLGRSVRYTVDDVKAFIESRKTWRDES